MNNVNTNRIFAIILACVLAVFTVCACDSGGKSASDVSFSGESSGENSDSVSGDVDSESSGSDSSSEHIHSYGIWYVTKDATCLEEGERERYCSCGEVRTESTDKLPHQYDGNGVCAVCGTLDPDYLSTIISLNAYNGSTVDVCNQTIRSYIDNRLNPGVLAGMLREEYYSPQFYAKQDLIFSFSPAKRSVTPFKIYFADNADFTNAFEYQTSETAVADVGYFIPGQTYYWKVADNGGKVSATDTFTVKDEPVRWITAGTMKNVRDCGGWTTESGAVIPYGLLFRGDGPENADNAATKIFNYLGIKGEIDLRIGSTLTENFLNAGYPFLNAGINYFYQIVPGEYNYSTAVTDAIGDIIEFLANKDNYPVYFHCSWGKDRTGTLAFIIGGLLGVKYEDLMCDYELSSYGKDIDWQPRNTIVDDGNNGYIFKDAADDPWGAVGRLNFVLRREYATSESQPLSEVVAQYLKSACGVTDNEIAAVRCIFLG